LASNLQQYMVVPVTICDLPCPIFRGTNSESEDKVSLNDGGEGSGASRALRYMCTPLMVRVGDNACNQRYKASA